MTRSSVRRLGLLLGSIGLSAAAKCAAAPLDGTRYVWFNSPGADWETSAQLIGCGRLGAALFGGGNEILTLNEDTIWDGPIQQRIPPNGLAAEPQVRQDLLNGDYTAGGNLCLEEMTPSSPSERGYSYFGTMHLDFGHTGTMSNYVRWLDTKQGNAGVNYTYNGVQYTREYIANFPSNVITARITASQQGALSFNAYFNRTQYILSNTASTANGVNSITLMGSSGQPANQNPIEYTGQARFVASGATFSASGDTLHVSGATTVDIFFDAETSVRYSSQSAWESEMNSKLSAAVSKGFPALKSEAIADVTALINRASINFGSSPNGQANLPIDQRVNAARSSLTDLELLTLTWNYGRHLLVGSSRNTPSITDYPPNLQGVWSNDTSAPWGGKFTININIEMNLWPAEQTNLGATTEPLFELMELAKPRGEQMAQGLYGCNGTVFHHNLDVWGDPAPTDNFTTSTMWQGGAAWLVQHMADHYKFSGDKNFLQNTAYPFLVDVATFYQCYTMEWEGNRVTGPALSPENAFFIPSNGSVAGQQAAMDIAIEVDNQLMRDIMNEVINSAEALGISSSDPAVVAAKNFLPLIREPRTGSYGQILEWRYEYGETDPGNRHLSPLYGLHPSNQFGPLVNETLFNAAKALLDHRVSSGSGSTGWSRTWLINQYARALSASDVWTHITKWYAEYPTTALWNTDHGATYQIDGNFGITSGLTEMVLQSQTGTVHILPALPSELPTGSFNGLMARGGFEVNAQWSGGKLTSATITSQLGNQLAIRLENGASFKVNGNTYSGPISTSANQQFTITPS